MIVLKYYMQEMYGNTPLYCLANPTQASLWGAISNKRTITGYEMHKLARLTGVAFERVFGPEVTV